jgi:hypothetical protein
MVQSIQRMAAKIFKRPQLTGTIVEPVTESEINDEQIPGYAELRELREGTMDYTTWLQSSYSYEMQRRKAYYEMTQVETDAGSIAGMEETYITPGQWNLAHSGPGWQDLRAMLPDATEETCVKPVMTNLCQVIIDNRQVVYDSPAEKREVLVNGKVDVEYTNTLKLLYEACAHDLASKHLCKWTGLFATAFQCVTYDEFDDRLIKTNLEPYRVMVIDVPQARGNLQHPDCMVAIAQDLENIADIDRDEHFQVTWQVWWRDMWWYEQQPGVPYKDVNLTEAGYNANPFRDNRGRPVKPILVVHDNPTVTRVHEPGSDILVNQNQVIDRMLTGAAHTIEYQNFAVPVITGADLEEVESQPYSPGAPQVYRNPDTSFQFAHPAAPIGEVVGADTRIMRTFARLHSIDPELVDPETKVQSGVSRMQARTALVERRNQEFPKWNVYERESFWISIIVWNAFHPGQALAVPDRYPRPNGVDIEMLVQFGEVDLSVDPLTEATVIDMYLRNDLITRADVIASNRRVPIQRATEILKQIQEQNKQDKPEPTSLLKETTPRIGQNGNRPMVNERDRSKTGGNTTSGTGNITIGGN